jgi:hypothetical protein
MAKINEMEKNMMKKNKWLILSLMTFFVSYIYIYIDAQSPQDVIIQGCPLFPADNIWNTPVDTLPVDPNSSLYINTIGADEPVHADFGSGLWEGEPIGIPFTTVPGTQVKVAVTFYYDDESDPGPYPIPADAPIEGGSDSDGDRHVLVVDRDNCILYELYDAYPQPNGSWTAGSGAIFDLNSNDLRPAGWTSADAAGLPILPGLVRYEEVAAGEIKHAIRVTAPQTRRHYIWPARHYASSLTGSQYPPMGQRFRLKADFDVSGFSTEVQVILQALKKYGMILADNGSSWFISGVPDERWDNDVLHELHNVQGSDFEAVDESSLMIDPDSAQALQPQTPKSIEVTLPAGGENWTVGSTQNITWTTSGSIGNVKIELLKGGNKILTILSTTSNDGSQGWTLPESLSTGSDYQIKITDTSDESVSDTSQFFTITITSPLQPEISLDRTQLNAGAVISGAVTGSQTFSISNNGTGTLNWTIADDAEWLSVSPTSGTNSGVVTVSIDASGLSAGTYNGTITIADPNAANSPQTVTVTLTVKHAAMDLPPLGTFETPIHGSTVRSSIPVTGWALDDVGVESVKIYRRQGGQLVYLGDAIFVEGARPDIEGAYPGYPLNYRAGWGYMMLTNFLPNSGNGTFTIHAVAADSSGQSVTLGTKTITCDNANAVKPFGAIDTPLPGSIASGSSYRNHGWVLTPLPNSIPTDGSTINVYVDGVDLGHPVYNIYRPDIAALFPGYANSDGAHAYFDMDTTAFSNGVHTIAWIAMDNAGNSDGIGSRYFTVQNSSARSMAHGAWGRDDFVWSPDSNSEPIEIVKGYKRDVEPETIYPDKKGNILLEIKELQRIEIHFFHSTLNISPLPIGSTLDAKRGVFYWQPGPGFTGEYQFVFFIKQENGALIQHSNKKGKVLSILTKKL